MNSRSPGLQAPASCSISRITLDGSRLVGPPLNAKFGTQENLEGGATVTIDEGYLRESILVPGAKIVAGYPPSMPPYQGQLNDVQVEGLVEYIKSLK